MQIVHKKWQMTSMHSNTDAIAQVDSSNENDENSDTDDDILTHTVNIDDRNFTQMMTLML